MIANFYFVNEILFFFWKNYKEFIYRLMSNSPGWIKRHFNIGSLSRRGRKQNKYEVKFFTKNHFEKVSSNVRNLKRPSTLINEGYPDGYKSPKTVGNNKEEDNYRYNSL